MTDLDYENITFFFIINSDQREGRDQGFGSESESVMDPDSIRSVDPDLDPYSEFGTGTRRAKMTHKSIEKN